jgi:nucleoside-diphosphate-sugar epimerase
MTKTGVVLGLGGQIGSAVARRMLSEGWTVRGLDLGGSSLPADLTAVDLIEGDRNDAATLARVIGHGADGVVDTIAYTSSHAQQLLACANDIGALAVISSLAVYADDQGHSIGNGAPALPVPVPESQRLVAADDATYGGGKVMLESILLDAGRFPVTVLRPAAVCGPHSRHLREWWLIKRVLDGRVKLPLQGQGGARFHPSSTANIAALAVHSLGLGHSQVLNAADPDCPNVIEIAGYVAAAMNHRWQIVPLADSESTGSVGDTPWTAERPIVLDTASAINTGYQPVTRYADAIPGLVQAALDEVGDRDWSVVYPGLAGYPTPQFDYLAEDQLLRELGR